MEYSVKYAVMNFEFSHRKYSSLRSAHLLYLYIKIDENTFDIHS